MVTTAREFHAREQSAAHTYMHAYTAKRSRYLADSNLDTHLVILDERGNIVNEFVTFISSKHKYAIIVYTYYLPIMILFLPAFSSFFRLIRRQDRLIHSFFLSLFLSSLPSRSPSRGFLPSSDYLSLRTLTRDNAI